MSGDGEREQEHKEGCLVPRFFPAHGAARGKSLHMRLVRKGDWQEGEGIEGGTERGQKGEDRDKGDEFQVRMYDDMICASHAPSPSYQFCC